MSGDEENENPTDSLDSASWQEHKEIHNVTVIGTRGGGGGVLPLFLSCLGSNLTYYFLSIGSQLR